MGGMFFCHPKTPGALSKNFGMYCPSKTAIYIVWRNHQLPKDVARRRCSPKAQSSKHIWGFFSVNYSSTVWNFDPFMLNIVEIVVRDSERVVNGR